jgi:hypothetical protein
MGQLGPERTGLGSIVADVMDTMSQKPRYFLDNGTLLGIWRDGGLIDCDDDFDFGILVLPPFPSFLPSPFYPFPSFLPSPSLSLSLFLFIPR